MTNRWTSAARAIGITTMLALVGCTALPERLEGTNYAADGPPFVADTVDSIAPEASLPEQEGLVHRVLLVGDAGVPLESEPVLEAVASWSDAHPDSTTVVYLGDNLYPSGLEEDDRERGEAVLQAQLDAGGAPKLFLPGNHDWGFPHQGPDRVVAQQQFVESKGATFLPRDGCPGPVHRTLVPAAASGARGLGLVLIDIDPWFVDPELRADCPDVETPEQLADALATMLRANAHEALIVAAHHPLRTGGPHGGYTRGWLGDFVTGLILWRYGSLQDAYEEGYRAIIEPVEGALATAPPLVFAAGHDHNLQILEGGGHARVQVVSGAGATKRVRGGHVTDIAGTLFAHGHPGFMALDVVQTRDGRRARLHVVETGQDAPVLTVDLGAP